MSNAQLALQQAQPSADFESKLARSRALLQQAARECQPLVQASSLGAEDVVIRHLIETLQLPIPMCVLDTGTLHPETLELLARTQARAEQSTTQSAAQPVHIYPPQAGAAEAFVEREGPDAMRRSVALRQACCAIRKVEPLRRALHGHRAWVTGLRREQSATRAEVPLIDHSDLDPARADRPSAGLLQFSQRARVVQVLNRCRQPQAVAAGHSAGVLLECELDVSRGDWLLAAASAADPRATAAPEAAAAPYPARQHLSATVAWLDDEPLQAGRLYWALHQHRWVKAKVVRVLHRRDIHTLERVGAERLEANAIGRVELQLQAPLPAVAYAQSRALGALILVDSASHRTAAAVLLD